MLPPGLAGTAEGSHAMRRPHMAAQKAMIASPIELAKLKGAESVLPGHAKSATSIVAAYKAPATVSGASNRGLASIGSVRHPPSACQAATQRRATTRHST